MPRDTVTLDPRPGGVWHMTMVNSDNPEWKSTVTSTLVEVVENQLLVGYDLAEDFPGIENGTKLTLIIELTPEGGGTWLELRQGPFPEDMREMRETGWRQSLYRLDGLLATPATFRTTG